MRIRFDHGPTGQAVQFRAPVREIIAWEPADVPAALKALDAARAQDAWLAGYASYELGYALEPKLAPLMPEGRRVPLLRFGVYDGPDAAPHLPEPGGALGRIAPRWDAARYGRAFETVRGLIGAGDIYQANLTFPIDLEARGDVAALYAGLVAGQPVGYGALVEQADGPDFLSRSPELFFRTDAAGVIETRPMKGTAPRGETPEEDAARAAALARDEKNCAENLMIVDLLRNDISRICRLGTVRVPELFKVETYATVHQMVSLVRGEMQAGTRLSDIFRALFPCGSITGAPKVRAMEILRDLEPWPRDIYCGSIGWAAPDGRSEFNVAIRTLSVEDGRAVMNVGGGVVWDSVAGGEYEEALWKSRFAQMHRPERG